MDIAFFQMSKINISHKSSHDKEWSFQQKPTGTIACKTRCVGTTRIFPPWILRRLANVSPFFNSLSNRLRITNYSLRSVSSSLLKFTKFIQGNNIAWTNLDMIRNLQQISKPNSCKLTKNHSTGTNLKLICNLWLYTLIPKIKSISQIIVK